MSEVPPKDQWLDPAGILLAKVPIGATVRNIEAFKHQGTIWLALQWLANDAEGWMQPVRIVSLRTIRHNAPSEGRSHVVVNEPMPADMFPPDQPLETAKRTLVEDNPEIWFAIPNVN